MFNLMRADIYRIMRGKGIYICLVCIAATICFSTFLKSAGHLGINVGMPNEAEMEKIENMDDAWDMISNSSEHPVDVDIMSVGGNLYFFFIVVVFMVSCTDLSNHTAKNIISSGISRTTYYASKLGLSLIIGTMFILFRAYAGYLINYIWNGSAYTSGIGDITMIMIRQLPVFYGMIGVLVMISAMVQKTAKFNAITILLIMAIQVLFILISVIMKIDSAELLKYEFEGMISSLAVLGSVPLGTLLTTSTIGISALLISTAVGMNYFKRCTIK